MRPQAPHTSAPRYRHRPTHVRVDRTALTHNVAQLRTAAGTARLMAVLKADAYGHGLVPVAHHLADLGVDYFGVAFLEEGIALRQAGVEAPVLVLGGLVGYQLQHFLDYHLELTASSPFKAKQIDDEARRLGRVAPSAHQRSTRAWVASAYVPKPQESSQQHWVVCRALIPWACLRISHAPKHPDTGDAHEQVAMFGALLEQLRTDGTLPPLVHVANTAALLTLPQTRHDLVRPGIGLFGVGPAPSFSPAAMLRPTLSVHTEVVFLKGVRQGAGIGYGHAWHAPRDGWLVTLPVGYGDGYPRALSNRAEVLIGGRRFPVVGNISMDQMMVWLDDATFEVGEPVVLLGRQGGAEIDAWELAERARHNRVRDLVWLDESGAPGLRRLARESAGGHPEPTAAKPLAAARTGDGENAHRGRNAVFGRV